LQGSDGTTRTLSVGHGPTSPLFADLDGDGRPELLVANWIDDTVSVASRTLDSHGQGPSALVAADFNGDERPDLAVAHEFSWTVSIFLNDGRGNLVFLASQPAGERPTAMVAADFDHDGQLDLALANNQGAHLSILEGRGDGRFDAERTFPSG